MTAEKLREFLAGYEREIAGEAGRLADQEMPGITEELFGLFEKTGNRLRYEEVYFARRKFLAVFGLAALLQQKKQGAVSETYLGKLAHVMEEICRETCWALPAHVNRAEAGWRSTVDLFACETAQTLAELTDRLKDAFPDALGRLVRENIRRRVLQPFFAAPAPYGSWEGADNNWNAVCAGSIGSACLHLMREDRQRLELCLDRICESLAAYVDGFAEDGACLEGLGYYTYGMTYFVNFAEELYAYTKGQRDLLCGKWGGFQESRRDKRFRIAQFPAKCFLGDGRSISFSDGDSRDTYRVGISCALARRFGSKETVFPSAAHAASLHGDPCYRFAALKMDLEETERYLEQEERAPEKAGERPWAAGMPCGRFHILPSAQWCIGHAKSGVGFACKGGHNGEPHNHNDVGHFIYTAGGVVLFADLGAGEYTKEYFGNGRYGILCNRSLGHSVPLIDGQEQRAGNGYRCGGFGAGADGSVRMELAEAYPKGLLERFERTFRFDLVSGRLLVEDSIRFSEEGREVTENLVTQICPVIAQSGVVLEEGGVRTVLSIEDMDPAGIRILEYAHSNHQGKLEKVYALQWQVPVSGRRAVCAFSVDTAR